jgi:hypothetical protein
LGEFMPEYKESKIVDNRILKRNDEIFTYPIFFKRKVFKKPVKNLTETIKVVIEKYNELRKLDDEFEMKSNLLNNAQNFAQNVVKITEILNKKMNNFIDLKKAAELSKEVSEELDKGENAYKEIECVYKRCVEKFMSFLTTKINTMKATSSTESILKIILVFMNKASSIIGERKVEELETFGRRYVKELNRIKKDKCIKAQKKVQVQKVDYFSNWMSNNNFL